MLAIFVIVVLFAELSLLSLLNTSATVSEISDTWVIVAIIVLSIVYIFALDKSKKMQGLKIPLLCGYVCRIALSF